MYGYASEGESFSIADASGEVWIMEVIGRGPTYEKRGAVWVARLVSGTCLVIGSRSEAFVYIQCSC